MKKFLPPVALILPVIFGLFSSCESNSVEELFPVVCDSVDTVSYSQYIAPLFVSSCGASNMSCHVSGSSGGSTVVLDSYLSVTSTDTTLLLASIHHRPGAKPMPRNAGKLNDCNIGKIEQWLRSGSPNN